ASLEPREELLIGVVELRNTGSAILAPAGEAKLIDGDGVVIGVTQIELGSVYSGTSANIYVSWSSVPQRESYSLEISLVDATSGATASSTFANLVPASATDAM